MGGTLTPSNVPPPPYSPEEVKARQACDHSYTPVEGADGRWYWRCPKCGKRSTGTMQA